MSARNILKDKLKKIKQDDALKQEMLEALESFLTAIKSGCETEEDRQGLIEIIQNIISKARGES